MTELTTDQLAAKVLEREFERKYSTDALQLNPIMSFHIYELENAYVVATNRYGTVVYSDPLGQRGQSAFRKHAFSPQEICGIIGERVLLLEVKDQ